MTDLERFFERLVRNLAATDPAAVTKPIAVQDIKNSIMPYRNSRRALGLESSEEYEELLVRLVSGEDGLVRTNPPEVAEWCQRQMSSLTPDLSGIPGQATATIALDPEAISRVMGAAAAAGLAKAATDGPEQDVAPERCPHCQSDLPTNRAVNFCPACGRSVTAIPCDNCGSDMEPGWRFCVNCGQEVSDAAAPTT